MSQKGSQKSQKKMFRKSALPGLFIFPLLFVLLFFVDAYGGTTERVSVDSNGVQANGSSGWGVDISADGRFVAFNSYATNLVPGDTNRIYDIFVHDRQTGFTERVSVDSNGVQANSGSLFPSISGDGRFVAFESGAKNLVPGDTNGFSDVFVHDRLTGVTERVNVDSNGIQVNSNTPFYVAAISADGRFVAFYSYASNLVPGDTNGTYDVFIRDRLTGITERVSVDSNGIQGNNSSGGFYIRISADGRFVAFQSSASNLVPGDTNGASDVFIRDRQTGVTERVSVDSNGIQGNGSSSSPSMSADGRFVAFTSNASNLDPSGVGGVFVRDRQTGITERIPIDWSSWFSMSADGRFIAILGYDGTISQVYVHDRQTGITEIASVDNNGIKGNNSCGEFLSISADGKFVAFMSSASNLVPGDTNNTSDFFVREIDAAATTTYDLTVTKTGNGTVTSIPEGINCGSACTKSYNGGTSVTLTATPDTGSTFTGWSGACSGTGTCIITMDAAKNVTATFVVETYTITASAGAGGSISPSTAAVNYGSSQTFTITPNTGYHTVNVVVDGSSMGAISSYTFNNVTANHTISASFAINTFTTSTSVSGGNGGGSGGAITASPSVVNYGSSQTFTITPDVGYHIVDVLVDGVSVGAVSSYTLTNVTANHTISASFAIDTFTTSTSVSGGNGGGGGSGGATITASPSVVNYGDSQTFTIIPDVGYHITDVLVDGVSVGAVSTYTINNITRTHTIRVVVEINTYTLIVLPCPGGNVTWICLPSCGGGSGSGGTGGSGGSGGGSGGGSTVNYGGSQTFTITPDTGYHIVDVLVDGVSVGAVSTYTISGITSGHTVQPVFAINTYTPNISVSGGSGGSGGGGNGGGTITAAPSTVNYGGSQTLTITPNTGYHITDVLINGVSVGAVSTYTVNNITADYNITAVFDINTYEIVTIVGPGGVGYIACNTYIVYLSQSTCKVTTGIGYHLLSLTDNGVDVTGLVVGDTYTITGVNEGHNLVATFAPNTYSITTSAGSGGFISPSSSTVNYGGSQTYTITPDVGYHITDVLVDGVSVGAVSSYTLSNVTANHSLSAAFGINIYNIGTSASAGGTASCPSTAHGSTATCAIVPATGYHIASVSGCGGTLNGNTYTTGQITSPCTVTATFEINTYLLNVTKAGTGSGTVTSAPAGINCGADCAEVYNHGTMVTLTAAANTGSTFTGWSGGWSGACSGTGLCTVTMDAARNVTATFADTTHPQVKISATPNILWPPNHKLRDVVINGSAIDNESGIASVVITVTDEYGKYNMTVPGFGHTIQLEAWRDGKDKDGRVYTITVVAVDNAGNKTTAATVVTVPHDMSDKKDYADNEHDDKYDRHDKHDGKHGKHDKYDHDKHDGHDKGKDYHDHKDDKKNEGGEHDKKPDKKPDKKKG